MAAFTIIINNLLSVPQITPSIYCLYISPLKALANDINRNLLTPLSQLNDIANRLGYPIPKIDVKVRTGDSLPKERQQMQKNPPHILITTPESAFLLFSSQIQRKNFSDLKYIIIDEIHSLVGNKRGVHLSLTLARLHYWLVKSFGKSSPIQIGMSATLAKEDISDVASFLVGFDPENKKYNPVEIVNVVITKPIEIQIIKAVKDFNHTTYDQIWDQIYNKCVELIKSNLTTLIFTNSRFLTEKTALELSNRITDRSLIIFSHHGSLSREFRLEVEQKLKNNEIDVVVATSSLELGIDIGSINQVIQLGSPKNISTALQRIGRAGHTLTKLSSGIFLPSNIEELIECIVIKECIRNHQIERIYIPKLCSDILAQHLVSAGLENISLHEFFQIVRRTFCYQDLEWNDYHRIVSMLEGQIPLDISIFRNLFSPRLAVDPITQIIFDGSKTATFQSSGTIPELGSYTVILRDNNGKTSRIGTLDEEFVSKLKPNDIFQLGGGSSTFQVSNIYRDTVEVVYGADKLPTLPFWSGIRPTRSFNLGLAVAAFYADLQSHFTDTNFPTYIKQKYLLNSDLTTLLVDFFTNQFKITNTFSNQKELFVEDYYTELGHHQILIHSPYGIRINDTWLWAILQALMNLLETETIGSLIHGMTSDDGILLDIIPPIEESYENPLLRMPIQNIMALVNHLNIIELLKQYIPRNPIFKIIFRINCVRSMIILRQKSGKRVPLWKQRYLAQEIFDATLKIKDSYPIYNETYNDVMYNGDVLDVLNTVQVLKDIAENRIVLNIIHSDHPSPYAKSLFQETFAQETTQHTDENKARLLQLHHEVLEQLLNENQLVDLLNPVIIAKLQDQWQSLAPGYVIRFPKDLFTLFMTHGDLDPTEDSPRSFHNRIHQDFYIDALVLIQKFIDAGRLVRIKLPVLHTESKKQHFSSARLIPVEFFSEYKDVFVDTNTNSNATPDSNIEKHILDYIPKTGITEILLEKLASGKKEIFNLTLEKLERQFLILQKNGLWYRLEDIVPVEYINGLNDKFQATKNILIRFLKSHGPISVDDITDSYPLTRESVIRVLNDLKALHYVSEGIFLTNKPRPQYIWFDRLQLLHKETLRALSIQLQPIEAEKYSQYLLNHLFLTPEYNLAPTADSLLSIIQLFELEVELLPFWEWFYFIPRIKAYSPLILDELFRQGRTRVSRIEPLIWKLPPEKFYFFGAVTFYSTSDEQFLSTDIYNSEFLRFAESKAQKLSIDLLLNLFITQKSLRFDQLILKTHLDSTIIWHCLANMFFTGQITVSNFNGLRHAKYQPSLQSIYKMGNIPNEIFRDRDIVINLNKLGIDLQVGYYEPNLNFKDSQQIKIQDKLQWRVLKLFELYGIITKYHIQKYELWFTNDEFYQIVKRLVLLGKVIEGHFLSGIPGIQYALPEALNIIRSTELVDQIILLNSRDPANVYGFLWPLKDSEDNDYIYSSGKILTLALSRGKIISIIRHQRGGAKKAWICEITFIQQSEFRTAKSVLDKLILFIKKSLFLKWFNELRIIKWNNMAIIEHPIHKYLVYLGFHLVTNYFVFYRNQIENFTMLDENQIPSTIRYL